MTPSFPTERTSDFLEGGDDPDDVIPIGFDRRRLDRAAHEAFDAFVGRRRGDRAEFPVGDVAQTGHEPEAEKMAKGKDMVRRAAGISVMRSEEHTSELQSLMRISYAVFCLKKK